MRETRTGRNPGQFGVHHGLGQPPGRLPAFQEGKQLNLAWLFPEELAGLWNRYRPSCKGAVPLQPWITKPIGEFNDFLLDSGPDYAGFHVGVLGVRGNVVAITGMDPEEDPFTGWGDCRYTTIFMTTAEARVRLRPKFVKLRPSAWDRLVAE